MADSAQPYDELAAHYDQIFEDWDATIVRQALVLGGILHHECGDRNPIRVLDCACGIGTQSLGLAMNGFDVEGCDISWGAVQRARSEALKRRLSVQFSVANMLQLSALPASSFDVVICIDNSLPHLESDEQLLLAAQQAYGKLRGGLIHWQHSRLRSLCCGKADNTRPQFLFGQWQKADCISNLGVAG
jgi:glycine/sarcosine N-methyltransferase